MRLSRGASTCFAALALGGIMGGSPALAMKSRPTLPAAKQLVHDRGVGKGVKIKQVDGTSVRGKIASIGEDSFTMTVSSDKPTVEIPYAHVSSVDGPGLPKAVTITIVVVLVLVGLGIAGHFT